MSDYGCLLTRNRYLESKYLYPNDLYQNYGYLFINLSMISIRLKIMIPIRLKIRFEPHRRHCVVVLEQDTFILA